MDLFKNKVGRPSNETLRKRKMIYAGGSLFAVLFIISAVILLKDGIGGVTTSIAAGTKTLYLTNTNGALIKNQKVYAKGTKFNMASISGNSNEGQQFLASSSGNTKVSITGIFGFNYMPKKETIKVKKKIVSFLPLTFTVNETVTKKAKIVISTKKSFLSVVSTISSEINSNSVSLGNLQITKDVNYIAYTIYNHDGNSVESGKIYITTLPSAKISPNVSGLSGSDNSYTITKEGNYPFTAKAISNSSDYAYYYKIFKYSRINNDYKYIIGESGCYSQLSTASKSFDMNVNTKAKRRYAVVRVYASKALCDADTSIKNGKVGQQPLKSNTDTYKYVLATDKIKYMLTPTMKNSAGIVRVNYSLADLGKTIGTQSDDACMAYSLAYGHYIITGGQTKLNPVVQGKSFSDSYPRVQLRSNRFDYGISSTDGSVSDIKAAYNSIVSSINKGLPVVLKFTGNGTHFVLAVGYNSNVKSTDRDFDTAKFKNSIRVVDPYSTGHNKFGSDAIFERPIGTNSKCSSTDTSCTFTLKGKAFSLYRYWASEEAALDSKATVGN